MRRVLLSTLALIALGAIGYAVLREAPPEPQPPVVAPPVARKPVLPMADARRPPEPVASPPVVSDAVIDAGPYAAGSERLVVVPTTRAISQKQLQARVAVLQHMLERREATRGEALPELRALLQQSKDAAARADSEADRAEVWRTLDDVARRLNP